MKKTFLAVFFLGNVLYSFAQNVVYGDYYLPNLIPFQKNNKFGFCNSQMNVIIKCEFDFVLPFHDDCAILSSQNVSDRQYGSKYFSTVFRGNNQYRIDTLGKIVFTFPDKFNSCDFSSFPKLYDVYRDGDLFGIKQGDSIIIKAKFEKISPITSFRQSLPFIAKLNNKYGVIDAKYQLVDFKYDKIKYPFDYPELDCPLLFVERDNVKYYIDFCGVEYKAN